MSRDQRTDTALAHVIDEARREEVPSIDWDHVEDALMDKVRKTQRVQPHAYVASFSLRWAFGAFAMCAAGAAAFALFGQAPAKPAPVAVAETAPAAAATASGNVDGHTLAIGATVTAEAEDVRVEHAGHVTWTLEKGSAAHLESVGEVVALSLDRGVVSARVIKSVRPETFVVRVENTRIAVHGTEFRVERLGTGVRVRVTEGVLGIGPVGGPSFELRAPGAAMLNLDGARTDTKKAERPVAHHGAAEAPVAQADKSEKAGAPVPEEAAAPAREGTSPAPERPQPLVTKAAPPKGAEPLIQKASRAVQKCFASNTLSGGDLQVSVMTKMTLRVTTVGKIGDALFEPPLAPSVRSCVDAQVGAIVFPSSPEGFAATRSLELAH